MRTAALYPQKAIFTDIHHHSPEQPSENRMNMLWTEVTSPLLPDTVQIKTCKTSHPTNWIAKGPYTFGTLGRQAPLRRRAHPILFWLKSKRECGGTLKQAVSQKNQLPQKHALHCPSQQPQLSTEQQLHGQDLRLPSHPPTLPWKTFRSSQCLPYPCLITPAPLTSFIYFDWPDDWVGCSKYAQATAKPLPTSSNQPTKHDGA